MTVYRITHKKWANTLQASGFAARWNSNGIFMLYTAESMSLACLENLVHRNGSGLNALFEVMHIEIPNQLKKITLANKNLPKGWNELTENGHLICREIGDEWVKSQKSCVLRIPSVIIPDEYNVLLNCNHPSFQKIKIKKHHPFTFDKRFTR